MVISHPFFTKGAPCVAKPAAGSPPAPGRRHHPMAESKKSLLQQEREQDEQADRLHSGVLRIKEQAGLIKRELDDQNVILEKLEEDVDKAEGNMSALNKKMRTMVEEAKNSDKAMYTVIICLMILLGVLTMMVLS